MDINLDWYSLMTLTESCNPNPCQNGGTCVDEGCTCPENCSGIRCEICNSKPISNQSNRFYGH